jgi:hypothetical protein
MWKTRSSGSVEGPWATMVTTATLPPESNCPQKQITSTTGLWLLRANLYVSVMCCIIATALAVENAVRESLAMGLSAKQAVNGAAMRFDLDVETLQRHRRQIRRRGTPGVISGGLRPGPVTILITIDRRGEALKANVWCLVSPSARRRKSVPDQRKRVCVPTGLAVCIEIVWLIGVRFEGDANACAQKQ